jgi:hypothetical protein
VKDFERGPSDEAERVQRRPDHLYGRIREAVDNKAAQMRAAKGQPCVVVLYNAQSFVNLAPVIVAGALFGNLAFEVSLGTGETRTVFTGDRVLGDAKNTTVSAVATLSHVFLHQDSIDEVAARAREAAAPERAVQAMLEAISRLLHDRPETATPVPRLTVHHNPHAVAPLPQTIFTGPHDLHQRYLVKAAGS